MMRVLKIEQGRVTEPEIFSGMHLDEGMPQLAARKGRRQQGEAGETQSPGTASGRPKHRRYDGD